jgi:IS6 family transposase
MDETYVKVNGRWAYLPGRRQPGPHCRFLSSSRRNSKAAYRFLGKILNNVKKWQIPRFINTDKAPWPMVARLLCSNAKAGARLTLNTDRLSTGTT